MPAIPRVASRVSHRYGKGKNKKICDATSQIKSFTFSTQFTCFTSTKVQILAPEIEKGASRDAALQRLAVYCLLLSCFTSTRVQILTPDMEKGTSRDAALQRLAVYYFRSARQDDAATHSLGILS